MNSDYPLLKSIAIVKECRDTLISDFIDSESPDLFDALYSVHTDYVHQIKFELYETKWIEMHWGKISAAIENKKISEKEKKSLISSIVPWYKDFVSKWYKDFTCEWDSPELDAVIFEKRMKILKDIISLNNEWERNLKKMKVSFEHSRKIFYEKIKELEKENC